MAFQFSLAAVLRMRGIMEEREESLLQKILFDIGKTLDDLKRVEAELQQTQADRHAQALEPCLGLHLHASYGEIKQLQLRRKECEVLLKNLQAARDAQLLVYQAARRDRELLSNMRDEQRTAHEAQANRREQNFLDDNHIARRGRQ
jgi:flagellar export protein FliJ